MKRFLMATFMLVSVNAFAATDEELISKCLGKGIQKLQLHADGLNCKFNPNEVEASAVDNRWYNPSKYIWYVATLECPQMSFELEKLVQYYKGKCL